MNYDPNNGFLCVNKPVGISSFKVVHELRKLTKIKKIGHAGTLDPFASGVLVLALSRHYTRLIPQIQDLEKEYEFEMVLGSETDTLDPTGTITRTAPVPELSKEQILEATATFIGPQLQLPPQFSAKKVNGKRAYKLARQGETVALEPKPVEIFSLELLDFEATPIPKIRAKMKCSKGTYVRSLVRDLAEKLGTVGYTETLIRTMVGSFTLETALDWETRETVELPELIIRSIPK